MGVPFRRDVEHLLLEDPVLARDFATYDTATGGRVEVGLEWTPKVDVRAKVVNFIVDGAMDVPELAPFSIVRAHEAIANRDLKLDAILVNTEFVPLLVKAVRPWMGMKLKVFVHDEVPRGDIFGLAEPEFVGRVARSRSGGVGVLFTNQEAVVWGRFKLRGCT